MNPYFFMGKPVNFKDKFLVYPPKLQEIIDDPSVLVYGNLLTMQQEDVDNILTDNGEVEINPDDPPPTPLEYLVVNAYTNEEIYYMIQSAFYTFIRENVLFDFEQLEVIVGVDEEKEFETDAEKEEYVSSLERITNEDFEEFQNLIRESLGHKTIKPFNYKMLPRARRMRGKARYRDTLKTKEEEKGITLDVLMSSICLMDCGINPLNIGELTYAALQELFSRYQEKTQYETDIRLITIPFADTKSIKPKYWIRNLDNE